MRYLFAPGCALMLYKLHWAERLHQFLVNQYGAMDRLVTCCRHKPPIGSDTCVINICPGCDRRYRENYAHPSTVSLWELLSENDAFPFPDYGSSPMTIIDACPTRNQDRIHRAVRILAEKMNIRIVEPSRTKSEGTCCGDSLFGRVPTEQVVARMKAKTREMPLDEILVYCVSCSKAVSTGGKRPRYLIDLLLGEDTVAQNCHPDPWHRELQAFIDSHVDYEVK